MQRSSVAEVLTPYWCEMSHRLAADCPCNRIAVFGEVSDCAYTTVDCELPDGQVVQKKARVRNTTGFNTPERAAVERAAHLSVDPAFGRPIARRIIR